MEQNTPYSLKAQHPNSDAYYQKIAAFANHWLEEARVTLARPVAGYLAFRASRGPQDGQSSVERSVDETAYEMLVLGVLLREHGAQALKMPLTPAWMLAKLVETQDRLPIPAVEKPIKAVRGWVRGLAEDGEPVEEVVDEMPYDDGPAGVVNRLVSWLRAEGLSAQANRMAGWAEYLADLDRQQAEGILACCLVLAEDFAGESEAALGEYTSQVGEFVTCLQHGIQGRSARWRYDAGLITRTRVEYHLGMLGTEILTRVYRKRFLAMPRKVVVVPDCLCAHSLRSAQAGDERCQAERTSLGGKCQGCTPGCKVLALSRLGEKHGFEVYILPDDLRGVGLGSCSRLSGVGVVGVSCALTNWDAGWQVNDAGVPAQGMLLDYAGCRNHWHEEGIATDVNLRKLVEMVAGKE